VITGVNRVAVFVGDQDRAKEFWTGTMGFEVVQDTPYEPPYRWLEVKPPGQDVVLTLTPVQTLPDGVRLPGPGDFPPAMPSSWVWFHADDVQATYEALSERGVAFAEPPARQFFGWWAVFTDPDGNRYGLRQASDEPLAGSSG
jgi:lactoylglutathione lyase